MGGGNRGDSLSGTRHPAQRSSHPWFGKIRRAVRFLGL